MSKEETEIRTMLKTGASLVDDKKIDKIIEILNHKNKQLEETAIRIEIAKLWNGKLSLRIGDLSSSIETIHISKEEALSDISDEIDELLESKKEQEI